jgi:D-3-phosphoglycerate dehydrogenase
VNRIVSDLDANIRSQVLATDPDIGYLIMDIDQMFDGSKTVGTLETSIRTRILY